MGKFVRSGAALAATPTWSMPRLDDTTLRSLQAQAIGPIPDGPPAIAAPRGGRRQNLHPEPPPLGPPLA